MADIPISPKTPTVNGADVSTSNPLPATQVAAAAPATSYTISPTTFVVNGDIVSATNPLPIILG